MSYQPGGGGCQVMPIATFSEGRQILLNGNLKRNYVLQTCFEFHMFSKMLDVFHTWTLVFCGQNCLESQKWIGLKLTFRNVMWLHVLDYHLTCQTKLHVHPSQGYDRSADSIHHNRSCTAYPTESLRSLFGPTSFTRGQACRAITQSMVWFMRESLF